MSDNSLTSFTKELLLPPLKECRIGMYQYDGSDGPEATFISIKYRDEHLALLMFLEAMNNPVTLAEIEDSYVSIRDEDILADEGYPGNGQKVLTIHDLDDVYTDGTIKFEVIPIHDQIIADSIEGVWYWDPFRGQLNGTIEVYPNGYVKK